MFSSLLAKTLSPLKFVPNLVAVNLAASLCASCSAFATLPKPTSPISPNLLNIFSIATTPFVAKSKAPFIAGDNCSPIVLAKLSVESIRVDNFPLRVVACEEAPSKKAPPSLVKFISA